MGNEGFESPCLWAGVCVLSGVAEAEGDLCPWMSQPEEEGVVQWVLSEARAELDCCNCCFF